MDDTFTLEEVPNPFHPRILICIKFDKTQVEEVVEAISEAVTSEIETELINASHTNVLLLRQVIQASQPAENKPRECNESETKFGQRWIGWDGYRKGINPISQNPGFRPG